MIILASLLGGIGLFLLGMSMMTEGLKLSAGNALRAILQRWTSSSLRGLLAGILITGIVQSSSAVTVATVGFVNAGLLTLSQAVWVIFGTNIGTTMTGWLVALVGIKINVNALALPLLGVGMLLRLMGGGHVRRAGIGTALAGFGAFFLGVSILQSGFADLAPRLAALDLARTDWLMVLGFVGLGAVLTLLTQSSSAAIAITLTATAGGVVPPHLAAATVIGTNIGTTSTALFAAIGATAAAKRVASAHILFNLMTGLLALALLPLLLRLSAMLIDLFGMTDGTPATLAVFHTLFNCLGVALIWPLTPRLIRFLSARYMSADEEIGRPRYLDATLTEVPALALRGLSLELARMTDIAFAMARRRVTASVSSVAPDPQQDGLLRLGLAVRDFIDKLNKNLLPEDVAAALPDMLRAVQHLEDLALASAEITPPPSLPSDTAREDWQKLQQAVLTSLAADDAPQALADRIAATEQSYQQIKRDLLRAGATGDMPVATMEEALRIVRRLRTSAEAAAKAQRRLYPWRNQAHVPDISFKQD